jgi:hypothetical protein
MCVLESYFRIIRIKLNLLAATGTLEFIGDTSDDIAKGMTAGEMILHFAPDANFVAGINAVGRPRRLAVTLNASRRADPEIIVRRAAHTKAQLLEFHNFPRRQGEMTSSIKPVGGWHRAVRPEHPYPQQQR